MKRASSFARTLVTVFRQGPSEIAWRTRRRVRLARLRRLSAGKARTRWIDRVAPEPTGAEPGPTSGMADLPVVTVGEDSRPVLRELGAGDAVAVVLLDPGVALVPGALARIRELLSREEFDVAYADEVVRTPGSPARSVRLKPAWSPEMFPTLRSLGSPRIVRTPWLAALVARARNVDPLDVPVLEPTATGVTAPRVAHLARVLARRGAEPAAIAPPRATQEPAAVVTVPERPSLTVVVPTRDGIRFLRACVESLRRQEYDGSLEILVMDNGSEGSETRTYLAALDQEPDARVVRAPGPFNFSALMNEGARRARGEAVLFLNDDTEAAGPSELRELTDALGGPGVEVAGPLLLYGDGSVQHCGLVTGMGIVAGHLYRGQSPDAPTDFVAARQLREVTAVDGACFLVRRSRFLDAGGFDARHLAVSFGDVDYCLRVRERGARVVYEPSARFVHHETQSRNPVLDPREVSWMRRRWGEVLDDDPFYHPDLTLLDESGRLDLPGDRARGRSEPKRCRVRGGSRYDERLGAST